jgi:hypothetical protein
MRAMPGPQTTFLNPNDGNPGGYLQVKKPYTDKNQHIISHNAVLPGYDLQNWMTS